MSIPKLHSGAGGAQTGFRFMPANECDPTGLHFVIGSRGSGKTKMLCYLVHQWYLNGMKDRTFIDMVICFSPTEAIKQDFKVFVPYCLRYPRFNEAIVMKLVERQKAHMKKYGRCQNILLLVDDCAYEKGFFRTQIMRFISMNLRHYNIAVVITCQYALDVPPAVRGGIDYCWCFSDNSISNKERYWKHFFGQVPTLKQFIEIFDELTDNFGCIVGNNKTRSNSLSETLFWYRAKPETVPAQFNMGRPAYWRMAKKAFVDEDADVAPLKRVVRMDVDGKARHSAVTCKDRNDDDDENTKDDLAIVVARPRDRHGYGHGNGHGNGNGGGGDTYSRGDQYVPPSSVGPPPAPRPRRRKFQHTASSVIRRNQPTLPIEITI
jgi:hypothetical protein